MRRTTLSIEDALFRQIKKRAVDEARSLQATINDLLRQALAHAPRRQFRLRMQGWSATEQPGVDFLDRDKLFDLMDGR